jgi:hypothetical protein
MSSLSESDGGCFHRECLPGKKLLYVLAQKTCASGCDRRWCLVAPQIRLLFGLHTHQRISDLRLGSIRCPFYPFSCVAASRQLMGGSSEKVFSQEIQVRVELA